MSENRVALRKAMFDAKKLLCEEHGNYICFTGNPKRSGLFVEYNRKQTYGSDYQCAVIVLSFAIANNIPCAVYTHLTDEIVIYETVPDEVLSIYKECPEIFHINARLTQPYRLASVGCPVKPQTGKLYGVLSETAIDAIANHRLIFDQKTVGRDRDYYLCQNSFEKYVGHKLNVPTLSIKIHRNVFRRDQRYVLEVMAILSELVISGETIMNEEYG